MTQGAERVWTHWAQPKAGASRRRSRVPSTSDLEQQGKGQGGRSALTAPPAGGRVAPLAGTGPPRFFAATVILKPVWNLASFLLQNIHYRRRSKSEVFNLVLMVLYKCYYLSLQMLLYVPNASLPLVSLTSITDSCACCLFQVFGILVTFSPIHVSLSHLRHPGAPGTLS